METMVDAFRSFTDEQLLAEVRLLLERERTATSVLVASLAELDARKLYAALGYSSLYAYCTRELHMSEGSAHNRITAARVARRFPVAVRLLADGALTLTNATLLAPHLTTSNHMQLLQAAQYRTKREVQAQVAALHPDRPDLVTLHLTIRRETHDKLRRAQDLLRHALPDGNPGEVIDRALTLLIAHLEKTKLAQVKRPQRAHKISEDPRYIPAAVKRAVTRRDEGRCTFVGAKGRCDATGFLEFHHLKPFALGGGRTVDNITLRCRTHNQYEGEQVFGKRRFAKASPAAGGQHPP